MIVIDGVTYDVPIASLACTAEFLDKYAERNEQGDLKRELIGVYFNYQVKFGADCPRATYEALWQKLTEAEEFHTVQVPDNDGTWEFQAYFANVGRGLRRVKGSDTYWKDMSVNFIAKSPARTP